MNKPEPIKFISDLAPDIPRVISRIAYQKKDKRRASLFIAEEFAFGINSETVEKFRLRKGDEIHHALLVELRSFDERISARRTAMRFLNTRRRTRKEVTQKLKKDHYAPEIIELVMRELKENGLINDEEFSRAFIHDKRLAKPASALQLEIELRKKGVSKEVAQNIVRESDSEGNEEDRAMETAEKKWQQLLRRETDEKKRKQKLVTFLGSRGFEYEVIKIVVLKIAGNIEEEQYD